MVLYGPQETSSSRTKRQKTVRQHKSTEELWQVLKDALGDLPAEYTEEV